MPCGWRRLDGGGGVIGRKDCHLVQVEWCILCQYIRCYFWHLMGLIWGAWNQPVALSGSGYEEVSTERYHRAGNLSGVAPQLQGTMYIAC